MCNQIPLPFFPRYYILTCSWDIRFCLYIHNFVDYMQNCIGIMDILGSREAEQAVDRQEDKTEEGGSRYRGRTKDIQGNRVDTIDRQVCRHWRK